MIERRTLRCPHCGAPLPPESLRGPAICAFCGITSAPDDVAPSSGADAGGSSSRALDAGHLDCPRCASPLFEGTSDGVTLLGCGRCGGVWLDNESARAALATPHEGVADLAHLASKNASLDASVAPPVACPSCKRALRRVTEPGSGAKLDVCDEHGTWFDRYELGLVLQAAHRPPTQPTTYEGPVPDFRAGANTEVCDFLSIFAAGTGALLFGAGAAAGALNPRRR